MSIEFTPDQQKVIDLRERNILVSAAAGRARLPCWWSVSSA